MADRADVIVYYSLQSDYCYFLLDRLLELQKSGVTLDVRPILGRVICTPERYRNRSPLEQEYFETHTQRTADFLGLPYACPNPSPIEFRRGSLWQATDQRNRNEWLNRLFVEAWQAGQALEFLTSVGRMLWDGSTPGWDQGQYLQSALSSVGFNELNLLEAMPWQKAKDLLEYHAAPIINNGHWGVPLMVFQGKTFYGQDRFDQLIWRMKERQAVQ